MKQAKPFAWAAAVQREGLHSSTSDVCSYASVAGALVGAHNGVDVIPEDWIATVTEANPETDMVQLAERLTRIILDEYENA